MQNHTHILRNRKTTKSYFQNDKFSYTQIHQKKQQESAHRTYHFWYTINSVQPDSNNSNFLSISIFRNNQIEKQQQQKNHKINQINCE